ncbi:SpvB/TcaC N-terminal domain-containing protein [Micromonospora sp. DT41]|uniref:SpvB/TcaC N-terminal domain-containing protein n=1 Tax=Micromonospora sp. DT41 TaxID=3393437 RepID=UPI003CF6B519
MTADAGLPAPSASSVAPAFTPPALPKGGGAVRAMGDKFTVAPATGTGSTSIPVRIPPGRAGFAPQLALTYDSAAGNGPFGLGWSLPVASITRRTDKGVPTYRDDVDADVFILSGAEDLVPVPGPRGQRDDLDSAPGYAIRRYRPRIDGLYARIERWTRTTDGDVHWRSLSSTNVLSVYGRDHGSRVVDAASSRRVFSWLLTETRDDRGNGIVYEYVAENGDGIDLTRPCEIGRGERHAPGRATNRYLKSIRYGNRTPLLDDDGRRPRFLADLAAAPDPGWMFEVVLDYGEHHSDAPTPGSVRDWDLRHDQFSSYRSGFEVRTLRRCARIITFHHVPDSVAGHLGYDGPVSSMDLGYGVAESATYSQLRTITHRGYRRDGGAITSRALPSVRFDYSPATVGRTTHTVDVDELSSGDDPRWVDLHGEGIPGLLVERHGSWSYRRNTSPLSGAAAFSRAEPVALRPNADSTDGAHFVDLAGDGTLDVVIFDGPTPGLHEHDDGESWRPFRPLASRLSANVQAPNAHWADLTGDGCADVVFVEDAVFVWHPSLAEAGFGPGIRIPRPDIDQRGPQLVFSDPTQAVYFADLGGDGLPDLVQVRNGSVCYWPNLGHGRFGTKVVMDGLRAFDHPDRFDPNLLQLADIDGSGTTDLVYLHPDGIQLYLNQCGNGWSEPTSIDAFPTIVDPSAVMVTDLLGNGTACLVWMPSAVDVDPQRLRYLQLTGDRKPHLLVRMDNNQGVETHIRYTPSNTFSARDARDGRPWSTKLPYPVHVVERVDTVDRVSRNRFTTRYAYHHGYFDGEEREFRGFGLVDQWDTGELAALNATGALDEHFENEDPATNVAPVMTRTWFDLGTSTEYLPPGALEAPPLPTAVDGREEAEARRARKGAVLRQEVYGCDGSAAQDFPYVVVEHTLTVRRVQARGTNRHAVFTVHPYETVERALERNPDDPRVKHSINLEIDEFGAVLKSVAIAYGRLPAGAAALPEQDDRTRQRTDLLTYTEAEVTNPIADLDAHPDDHRASMPAQMRTFELTGYLPTGRNSRYQASDFVDRDSGVPVFESELDYQQSPTPGSRQRRLVEWIRVRYRADDLSDLLAVGGLDSRAFPGQTYQLAFTRGLLDEVLRRGADPLLPDPAAVLSDASGYVSDGPGGTRWWIPGSRTFLSPNGADTPAAELAYAKGHFFLPHRIRDPFHTAAVSTEHTARYDEHDLMIVDTSDAVGNRLTADIDYRVLQPWRVTDPNGNVGEAAFDVFGTVSATALVGKPGQLTGDSLAGINPDLSPDEVRDFFADPRAHAAGLLGAATTRRLYDLAAYADSRDQEFPNPIAGAAISREIHVAGLTPGVPSPSQVGLSYLDGFGRTIQQKLQAEPGPVSDGAPDGPRWSCTGWTVYDNKGRPVRTYEPFFSATSAFEFDARIGVSPVLFYDPLGRVAATLHPDHTYDKTTLTAWTQVTWDRNDTVLDDPRTDPDIAHLVAGYFAGLPAAPPWRTWHDITVESDPGTPQRDAADKAAAHARTPKTGHLDPLGRPFLTITDNGPDPSRPDRHLLLASRAVLDIEGNQLALRDAIRPAGDPLGRIMMRYDYDLAGRMIRQRSADSGARWTMADAGGQPLRSWDERGVAMRTEYDPMRRPVRTFAVGADPADPGREVLIARMVYGEQHPEAAQRNLRGAMHLHLDQAGTISTEQRDAGNNLVRVTRRLTGGTRYRSIVDWTDVDADHAALPTAADALIDVATLDARLASMLGDEAWTTSTTYDALNRPVVVTAPHTSGRPPTLVRSHYDEGNGLQSVDVNLRAATDALGEPVWTPLVKATQYDAHGRRVRLVRGNDVSTFYNYDPASSRLAILRTLRDGDRLQDFSYAYDPVGNVTAIRDGAQQVLFFANTVVGPSCTYTYDALYRLVEATGREHLGQHGPLPHSSHDAPRVRLPHPNDGAAMGGYTERYVYDDAGNMLRMTHTGTNPVNPGWTRTFDYEKPNNRLDRSRVLGGANPDEPCGYDAHANLTTITGIGAGDANLHWDLYDQLHRADLGGGGTVYYGYDADGNRVRKVWEKPGAVSEEIIYLAGFEIRRTRSGPHLIEREIVRAMDGTHCIAVVETRTVDTAGVDAGPAQLIRHQLANYLGSATLELDQTARIVSFEEYSPYGGTTFQSVSNQTETPKRYRFCGRERDDETGFVYIGARYYIPWLCRWASADPAGPAGGLNAFQYAAANPVVLIDADGRVPSLADVNRNLERVNRYATIMMGPGAIALKGLSTGVADVAVSYITNDGKGNAKAEKLADDVITSNIPGVGLVKTVVEGTKEVAEHIDAAREANKQGSSLEAAGHYVDAGLAGLETATVVVGDLVTLGEGGKLHSKVLDPTRAPKVIKTRPAAPHTPAVKEAAPVPPPKQAPPVPADSPVNKPMTQEARATYIHDRYGEAVVGGPLNATKFEVTANTKLDSRIADHYNTSTGTLYEFNTTPWSQLPADKLKEKVDFKVAQVGKDVQLRADRKIQQAVWYGTEALPTSGEGNRLRQALIDAGIQYQVVPLPPNLANLRPPVY